MKIFDSHAHLGYDIVFDEEIEKIAELLKAIKK